MEPGVELSDNLWVPSSLGYSLILISNKCIHRKKIFNLFETEPVSLQNEVPNFSALKGTYRQFTALLTDT